MRRTRYCAQLLPVLLVVAGCTGGAHQYDVVPVSGVVTCEGKPVANAIVQFSPAEKEGRAEGRPGRAAFGKTDEQGRFTLSTYGEDDGAIVGTHTVSVGPAPTEDTAERPNKFACADSTLQVTVEPGADDLTLDF
ncbi:hypothetical protein Mal4_38840 [Maioricimonas rarisocia]|uniref:Carboxypeptidase regulatory-like domain-containing protein n=1 Tax=Maioricimonas rarisocia TaxID=2528026 RepID=A0A517ZAT2_9PLAN|nr:DUF4198 domain-containing protein [Maioricimonas rarisocia]QDU39539.1 hypothetical protein Mal4_38840 [Maioricimonas rarisocia]